jgi:hypothetical protein
MTDPRRLFACVASVCTLRLTGTVVTLPAVERPIHALQPYGMLVDPLSSTHLLFSCAVNHRLYRISLADGALIAFAGRDSTRDGDGDGSAAGTVRDGPAGSVAFSRPCGMAVAYRDSDAVVLVLCDTDHHRLCLIRVPY